MDLHPVELDRAILHLQTDGAERTAVFPDLNGVVVERPIHVRLAERDPGGGGKNGERGKTGQYECASQHRSVLYAARRDARGNASFAAAV